jgi:hypothetical protein
MVDKKRKRKSEVDRILEGLAVGESHTITGSTSYWKNRQGLFHEKFPKRHVAIMQSTIEGKTEFIAKRID